MHSHECNPQTVIVCESVAFRKETIPLENKTTQTVLPVLTSKCLLTEFYFKILVLLLLFFLSGEESQCQRVLDQHL